MLVGLANHHIAIIPIRFRRSVTGARIELGGEILNVVLQQNILNLDRGDLVARENCQRENG